MGLPQIARADLPPADDLTRFPQTGSCPLPVCDPAALVAAFRTASNGQRFVWLAGESDTGKLGYIGLARRHKDDPEVLRNLLGAGQAIQALFAELAVVENWRTQGLEYMTREADRLVYTCLEPLILNPEVPTAQLLELFAITATGPDKGSATRYAILKSWNESVLPKITTKEQIFELSKFFEGVIPLSKDNLTLECRDAFPGCDRVSNSEPHKTIWKNHVQNLAKGILNGMGMRLLSFELVEHAVDRRGYRPIVPRPFELTEDEERIAYAMMKSDQGRRDYVSLKAQEALDKNNPSIERMAKFIGFGSYAKDLIIQDKNEPWALDGVSGALSAVISKYIRVASLDLEGLVRYFTMMEMDPRFFYFKEFLIEKILNWDGGDDYIVMLNEFLERAIRICEDDRARMPAEQSSRYGYVSNEGESALALVKLRLIKRPDVHADEMVRHYRRLGSDSLRQKALGYWQERSRKYDDRESLIELLRFFHEAGIDSQSKGLGYGESTQEAFAGERRLIARVTETFPFFEGVYEIEIGCLVDPDTGEMSRTKACGSGFLNRLIVLSTSSSEGLFVALANRETGSTPFLFSSVRVGNRAQAFETLNNAPGTSTHFSMWLDHSTRTIQGRLLNSDQLTPLAFRGRQLHTSEVLYNEQFEALKASTTPAVTLEELASGSAKPYRGKMGGRSATFSLDDFQGEKENSLSAVVTSDTAGGRMRMSYGNGAYNPRNQMLTLTRGDSYGNRHKLVAKVIRGTTGSIVLEGFHFSTINGERIPFRFERK